MCPQEAALTPGMLTLPAAGVKTATSLGRAFSASGGPYPKAGLITQPSQLSPPSCVTDRCIPSSAGPAPGDETVLRNQIWHQRTEVGHPQGHAVGWSGPGRLIPTRSPAVLACDHVARTGWCSEACKHSSLCLKNPPPDFLTAPSKDSGCF